MDNGQIMNHYINIFQSLISHKESAVVEFKKAVVEFKKAENSFDFATSSASPSKTVTVQLPQLANL